MSDETVVSEIESDAEVAQPDPKPAPAPAPETVAKPAPKPAPKPEQADPKQVSESEKAMKLWEHCCACVESGNEILIRDRSGLNTVLDINNL